MIQFNKSHIENVNKQTERRTYELARDPHRSFIEKKKIQKHAHQNRIKLVNKIIETIS